MSAPEHRAGRGGFTLIELMVAAAVAMLLLAGAFEMHAAFNRQNVRQQEIADMQQALRVATQVIARSVRDAGTGLFGGSAQIYDTGQAQKPCSVPTPPPNGSPPTPDPFGAQTNVLCAWGVQYGNRMVGGAYQYPAPSYDSTTTGDNDPDEDWLRVISFDGNSAIPRDKNQVGDSPSTGVIGVSDNRKFLVNGFFYIGNTYPASVNSSGYPTLGWRTGCLRQVTAVNPSNPGSANPVPGTVTFAANTYNPAPASDPCIGSVFPATAVAGQSQTVYVYPVDRSVVFKVVPGVGTTQPPQLQAWYSTATVPCWLPTSEVAPAFQTLAENIEHMQIAVVLNDGSVCGNQSNSVDNPAACNFQNVRAVRITLVARSSSSWYGWLSQGVGSQLNTQYWEDYPWPAANDGYLRRALTTEIEIRNKPWGTQ